MVGACQYIGGSLRHLLPGGVVYVVGFFFFLFEIHVGHAKDQNYPLIY